MKIHPNSDASAGFQAESSALLYSIRQEYQADFRERGSKFLAFFFPVWEDADFGSRLLKLRRQFHDATHHCSAMVRHGNPPLEQAHDDGEPSGTAGLPILNAVRSARAVNVGLVVVRYFGGTKLGKSGLIEAYGGAARLCIAAASLHRVEAMATAVVRTSYEQLKVVELLLAKHETLRLSSEFLENVEITVRLKAEHVDRFRQSLDEIAYTGVRYELGEPCLGFSGSGS